MIVYEVYFADGKVKRYQHSRGWGLKRLQSTVGGYLEVVPHSYTSEKIKVDHTCFVNEEARILGLPINPHFPKLLGNIVIEYRSQDEDTPEDDEESEFAEEAELDRRDRARDMNSTMRNYTC
jgi:hypothetical protein